MAECSLDWSAQRERGGTRYYGEPAQANSALLRLAPTQLYHGHVTVGACLVKWTQLTIHFFFH